MFDNSVLRRIFGLKMEELIGCWRKLCDEDLHNFYFSPNIIRMKLAGHVAHMEEKRNAYWVLVGKPEEWRPRRRPRCR
jgi:hypothetical protein